MPKYCKRVFINSLIDRAFLLSHPTFHKKNLEFVVEVLLDNGYPLELIFEKMNSRIKTLINSKITTIQTIIKNSWFFRILGESRN